MAPPRPQPAAPRTRSTTIVNAVALVAMVLILTALIALPAAADDESTPVATAASAASAEATFTSIAAHDELTVDHARLFRLYWAFFGRQPDPQGALYWVGRLDACQSMTDIADHFAASAEFVTRYGEFPDDVTGHAAFVDLAYHQVLDRAPDTEGGAYWLDRLTTGVMSRGAVMVQLAASTEFIARHPYPSDDVPARFCHTGDGRPTGRSVDVADGEPLLTVAGLELVAPSALIERVGFHQSTHPGALPLTAVDDAPARFTVLASRNRGTDRQGAADIVTEPGTAITAPVSGTVIRAGHYTLYCHYRDGFVVIRPDDRPDLEVKVLHVQNVAVGPGYRVEVGEVIAGHATSFPFTSQVDGHTASPAWPHVHLEVVDPSIPRNPSSGGGC
ncbi:MAG: DUF4214 domain-containing protein [Actinomycetota bacterium]